MLLQLNKYKLEFFKGQTLLQFNNYLEFLKDKYLAGLLVWNEDCKDIAEEVKFAILLSRTKYLMSLYIACSAVNRNFKMYKII